MTLTLEARGGAVRTHDLSQWWKVVGSNPIKIIDTFHWPNLSGRVMALGSTQPVTEMSTIGMSWRVKLAGTWGWQSIHIDFLII